MFFFWPDMATAHYEKSVIEELKEQNIEFLEKDGNLPNCPQLRPIEKYWALCKQEYKKFPNPSSTISSFRRRWTNISSKVFSKSSTTNSIKNHITSKFVILNFVLNLIKINSM